MNFNVTPPAQLALVFWGVLFVVGAIIHIAFAIAVWIDAANLPRGRRVEFVWPILWCLVTLFGGVFVAAIYWVMHHSTFCPFVFCRCQLELAELGKKADSQPKGEGRETEGA